MGLIFRAVSRRAPFVFFDLAIRATVAGEMLRETRIVRSAIREWTVLREIPSRTIFRERIPRIQRLLGLFRCTVDSRNFESQIGVTAVAKRRTFSRMVAR